MIRLLSVLSIIALSYTFSIAQIDISDARTMPLGSTVTVQGIATNGAELSIIRYIQDATGAIAAYPGSGSAADFPDNVSRGDLVEVTGELKEFNGLLEIDPITSYNVISSNNPLPDPLVTNPEGVNEDNEAKLLQINGVNFTDGGSTFGVGNYSFTANGQQSEIYVRSNHPLIGTTIPIASVNLTGIASQFFTQYQLLPRDANDIEIADDFFFTSLPAQGEITNEGFTLDWSTNDMGTTTVEYGTTPDLGQEMTVGSMSNNHTITFDGLDAATFYYVKAVSDNGSSTIESPIRIYSTASNSTGEIRVYFNHGVDGTFSDGSLPINTTPAAVEQAIINKILSAQSTIDVSAYNNNRTTIVAALEEAYNNGIQVRYIADDQTANLALSDPTPSFPIIYGNSGDPLMHNKFIVVDAESENDSWVFSGSMNLTSQNIADDYNNCVFIQDQALARAYVMEFEEMWGTDGPDPGIFTIKFGEDKDDNTPHLFNINGTLVESYFSPSDNTSVKIEAALRSATMDLQFALLTFTKNELGTAVRDMHDDGVTVRGIIDNINDQGSEYQWLADQGVNVTPDNQSIQTHHKYALVDATVPSNAKVVTGSHNWSNSAENRNDENTLIIHNASVANIFLQEFEARWCEANGGQGCFTDVEEIEIAGVDIKISPNPTSDLATVNLDLTEANDIAIALMDMNGRIFQSMFLNNIQGQFSETFDLQNIPVGTYLVYLKIGEQVTAKQIQVIR